MADPISAYEVWKLAVPLGRPIGDCVCCYDQMVMFMLCLKTRSGRKGWGFEGAGNNGITSRPAPWNTPPISVNEMRGRFDREYWPYLKSRDALTAKTQRIRPFNIYSYMENAIRIALWDLLGQERNLPLYQLFGGDSKQNVVRCYGSGLEFNSTEEKAVAQHLKFVKMGFNATKVKVGHLDIEWDVKRLKAIREAVGPDHELNIDANEAWTCEEALRRLCRFQQEGIQIGYLEDPLPRTDVEGLARLAAATELDIVGHDYVKDSRQLRIMLERKALDRLRIAGDFDHALACADLATEFDVPLIFCNSMFEINIHAAVALPRVERFEFSDLGWDLVPKTPVHFENGFGSAPDRPGHGLEPKAEALEEYAHPD